MDIETGAKRLAYFFLAIIWIGSLAAGAADGAYQLGRVIAFLLVFTVCYMILGAGIAWVYRGFRGKPR